MKAYDIISNRFQLDEELGYGVHGRVYSLKDCSDKVVKLSTLYDLDSNIDNIFEQITKVHNHIIDSQFLFTVKMFEFGFLESAFRSTVDGPQKYINYFSLQERLVHLSKDEKDVFKTVCDFHNKEKQFNRPLKEVILEVSNWIPINVEKVLSFYDSVINSSFIHHDFHRRNIMKDSLGNYKLIDFDRVTLKE